MKMEEFFFTPDYDKWREIPVEIPEEIMRQVDAQWERYNEPSLTQEEYKRLREEDGIRMQGNSPEALFYKLASIRKQPGLASKSLVAELEDALRVCYCGSGKFYMQCHGV